MRKFFTLLCSILCCTVSLFAQDAPAQASKGSPLSLEDALKMAMENNSTVKSAKFALDKAALTNKNTWNQFLPSISLSGGISNTHILAGPGSTNSSNALSAIAGDVTLNFNAGLANKFQQNSLAYKKALADYNNALLTVKQSVSGSFYSLLAEKKNIDILSENLKLTKDAYDTAAANYKKGLTDELTMLNDEYEWRAAGPALDKAQEQYREDLSSFCILIGMEPSSSPVPAGTINTRLLNLPSASELVQKYLDNNYNVQTAERSLESAKLVKQAVYLTGTSALAPSLKLEENLGYKPQSKSSFNLGGNSGNGPSTGNFAGTFSLMLSIPVDTWIPGSSGAVTRKNAKTDVASAEAAFDLAKKNAEQIIWANVGTIEQNAAALNIDQMNSRIANRSYELSLQKYRNGTLSQDDLQDANHTRLTAEQTVVTDEVAYQAAVYKLAVSLNMDVDTLYKLYGAE
jgi:multidrug efflux system outer membrane protein